MLSLYLQIFGVFFRYGWLAFGGVGAVLGELQLTLVEQRHWLTPAQFRQSFVVGQFVPGPNLAMAPLLGYQIAGWGGWLAAFLGSYSAPLLTMTLAWRCYSRWRERSWMRRVEASLRPVVFALILGSTIALYRETGSGHLLAAAGVVGLSAYANHRGYVGPMTTIALAGALWWLLDTLGLLTSLFSS